MKFYTVIACVITCVAASGAMEVQPGTRIAFLGDSITAQGNGPSGYIRMVVDGLSANGVKVEAIPAGVGGNKSNQMLERLQRDVINKKPDVLTVSCGVNDVWHSWSGNGIPLEQYEKNMSEIVDRAQAAKIRVYVMTSTMILEDKPDGPMNRKLIPYNDFLRELVRRKKCTLIDLDAVMRAKNKKNLSDYPWHKGWLITCDGIHMGPFGNEMIATEILRAFGLNDAQLAKAESCWRKMIWKQNGIPMTVEDYHTVSEKAFAEKLTVPEYIGKLIRKDLGK